MKRFLKDYRLHEYTEALFLLTLGIIIQVLDGSPLDVKHRWTLAWETELPREFFSAFIQKIIKAVLSMIILVRCLTSVLYVLSGFVAAYCILKETSPKLMLPWLFISGIKSVLLTLLETLTGVYVCSSFGKIRKPCIEFVISKAIELFFAIYLWACIRSIHKDMERFEEDVREEVLLTKMVIQKVNLRRRRARSMIDQTTLYKTANLNYFELKDVPNIIFDMLKTEEELSQDSLLSPGMMLASVSNMGSYDYLKTSLSLGELGFMDLNSFQVVGLDDDRRLCPYKRAMKFLKLTKDDVQKAKELTRRDSFIQNYEIPEEIPWNIIDPKPSTTHTRYHRQEEIFVAQLPDPGRVKDALKKKKRRQLPHDDILSDYDMSSEDESRASEEKIIGLEEGEAEENGRDDESLTMSAETDGETTPDLWFMTNRKDEVNRIGIFETHTLKRADNYERLYKQGFMSDIGPEVFDKASKLVKLTSLDDVNAGSYNSESKAQIPFPSTSRGANIRPTETAEPEEIKERTKTQKSKKKIAFEDHYDSHTTMPLSIVITNFPIKFNQEISKCEALYIGDAVPRRSGILFLPYSRCELSSGKCDMNEVCNEDSHGIELSAAERDSEDVHRPVPDHSYHRLKQAKSNLRKKFNLYVLKYIKSLRSDYKHNHKKVSQKGSGVREVDHLKLSIPKSPNFWSLQEENPKITMEEFIYPQMHEQTLFTKDLMKRPIRDVLKSYYNLRELITKDTKHSARETYAYDSIRKGKKKLTRESRNPKCKKYLKIASNFQKKHKKASDHETQVYFIEEGLRSYNSVERVSLACPISEKMKSDRKNTLAPLYLFGNKKMGWSSMPVTLNDGNNPFSRSCAHINYMPELGLSDGKEHETSTVGQENDTSSGLILPPEFQIRQYKKDTLCYGEQKASVEITLKPSELSNCSTGADEFYSENEDPASVQGTKNLICPDQGQHMHKILREEESDVELNEKVPLVRDSVIFNPSTTKFKIYSATSSNFHGSLDNNSRHNDPKTSNIESTTADQKTNSPGRKIKEFSLGGKNKKKLLNCGKGEMSRGFELKDTTTDETTDTVSPHLVTSTRRTGIIRNSVAILQKNTLQRIRQDGYSSFYS